MWTAPGSGRSRVLLFVAVAALATGITVAVVPGARDDGAAASGDRTAPSSAESVRYDVLFVAIDDLRCELPTYGAAHAIAPNLERFARTALVFDRAYCQVASCGPSRASVLTGARPETTGVFDQTTHFREALPDVVTFPEFFKDAGYTTQALGKVHHGRLDDPRSWSIPWTSLADRVPLYQGARSRGRRAPIQRASVDDATFHDGALAVLARDALAERASAGDAFWLGVGFVRPHLPFVAPMAYWNLYDAAHLPEPPTDTAPLGAPDVALRGATSELRLFAGVPRQGPLPAGLAPELRHGYLACVSYVDAQFGRVLDALDELGLSDTTIVVVWSDHGYKLGDYGAWCKKTCFEIDTRVPLMVRVPGSASAGARTDAIVELVDLYPTLAELCGLGVPDAVEGTSFAPLFDDPGQPWKSAAFSRFRRGTSERGHDGRSIVTRDFRLTRWTPVGDPDEVAAVELYDHRVDPDETRNRASDPELASERAELEAALDAGWRGALPVRADGTR